MEHVMRSRTELVLCCGNDDIFTPRKCARPQVPAAATLHPRTAVLQEIISSDNRQVILMRRSRGIKRPRATATPTAMPSQ